MHNWKSSLIALCLVGCVTVSVFGQAVEEKSPPSPEQLVQIAERVAPSVVIVEITAQSDKGEMPSGSWYGSDNMMPYGLMTMMMPGYSDWSGLIEDERPEEIPGFLLSDQRVLTMDPMLHPRFIKQIAVRQGDQVVQARIDSYCIDRNGLFLSLEQPLNNAKPLQLDATQEGPYFRVDPFEDAGIWRLNVSVASSEQRTLAYTPNQPPLKYVQQGLYTNGEGTPVALVFKNQFSSEEPWKQSPSDWPVISSAEMNQYLEKVEQWATQSLLRVHLRFRSPRSESSSPYGGGYYPWGGNQEGEATTEWNGTGVLVDPQHVLVLADLRPQITARLEAIQVAGADGQMMDATFDGTLSDYGGFFAKLSQPQNQPARLFQSDVRQLKDRLLMRTQVRVLGETRTAYFWRNRIGDYTLGWRRQVYPLVEGATTGGYWDDSTVPALNFLFTTSGELVAVPLDRREKIQDNSGYGYWYSYGDQSGTGVLAGQYLAGLLTGDESLLDPENRPLSEEEENRLAWIGVELQAMTPDLARLNNVADQTSNGNRGAIVTYIYKDSPAVQAGLKEGDLLLRLYIEGEPKPLEVQIAGNDPYGMMGGYWSSDMYEYMGDMPCPWGSVENVLTRALTDVGFGKSYQIEFFRDGEILTKDFVITQGPDYFESAKRFKSEAGGLTVRDLTYEVRRFFQRKEDDPGVIVSKIESGEPAAVAGLRPYEMILSVNDQPVNSADAFKEAISAGGEFRLNVRNMTASRVVTLKVEAEEKAEKE